MTAVSPRWPSLSVRPGLSKQNEIDYVGSLDALALRETDILVPGPPAGSTPRGSSRQSHSGSAQTLPMPVVTSMTPIKASMAVVIHRRRARTQLCSCSITAWVLVGVAK
jgi:hypothetical protein